MRKINLENILSEKIMKMFQIFLILLLFVNLTTTADPFSTVADLFRRAGLDDELDVLPKSKLQIKYNDKEVNLGNVFDPMSVQYQVNNKILKINLLNNYEFFIE